MTDLPLPEFLFDQVVDDFGDGRMIEKINDFVQEAADQKLLRDWRRDAAGEKIEHLIFIDLARDRTMAAFNVAGQSQQAEIEATTIPPTNDLESELVATLAPGNYTAIVRGKSNATGVGLVEVYNLQ